MKTTFRYNIGFMLILQLLILIHCNPTNQNSQKKLKENCIGEAGSKNRILVIKGDIIKLSDVNWTKCVDVPNSIRLFATKNIVIDVDLDMVGSGVQLTIMAPIWQVVTDDNKEQVKPGFRIINLSGSIGEDHDQMKALNGDAGGNKDGADGLAGLPGGPGGSFFGIANKIQNGGKLKIYANGGKGGLGQNGGDGVDGDEGQAFKFLRNLRCDKPPKGFVLTHGSLKGFGKGVAPGEKGETGGAAGNGGISGMGGNKGYIKILKLLHSSEKSVKTYAEAGTLGEMGISGLPGNGGKFGEAQPLFCSSPYPYFSKIMSTEVDKKINEQIKLMNNMYGRSGLKGEKSISLKFRMEAEKLPVQNIGSVVNQYKTYLRQSIATSKLHEKQAVLNFYNNLITNQNVAKLSDTMSLVEEFTDLEKQYYRLHKSMNLNFSYKALQRRINSYKKKPNKPDEKTREYQNVLGDLNRDIQNRQDELKISYLPSEVKTHIQKELKSKLLPIADKLEKLKRFSNILNQLDNRLSPLGEILEEGQQLIGGKLQTALINFEGTLDNKVNSILSEIKELKKNAEKHLDELQNMRAKLRTTVALKAVGTAIMDFGSMAAMAINPALGIVASVGTSLMNNIVAQNMDDAQNVQAPMIPDSFRQLTQDNLQNTHEKYLEIVQLQENYIYRLTEDKSPEEAAVVNKLWDSTFKLREQIQKKTYTNNIGWAMVKKYSDQEEPITTSLGECESGSPEYLSHEMALRAIRYLKTTSLAFYSASKMDTKYLEDADAIDAIESAQLEDLKNLNELNKAADRIYTEMEPMLQDVNTQLGQLFRNIGTVNEFQLAVQKYDFKKIFNDLQETLSQVNTNLDGNRVVDWALQNCKEQFDLVFKLQETLIRYKGKSEDKIDVGLLHIAHGSNLLVGNYKLQKALSELQVVMVSNVLVERYREWLSDFKQYAFPYSGWVLNHFQNLETFKDKSTTFIANDIIRNITNGKNYISSDPVLKSNILFSSFDGSQSKIDESRVSIYVWRKTRFPKTLNNILSGKKGQLVADIKYTDSHTSYDALKFNQVRILFTLNLPRVKNPKVSKILTQENLNRLLGKFDVEMIHNGSSTYQFGDKIYKCKNAPVKLRFGYSKNSRRRTQSIKDMAKGEYFLSPYTTWSVKLIPLNGANIQLLNAFKGKVDIELVGTVQYYTNLNCNAACKTIMKNYYKVGLLKTK